MYERLDNLSLVNLLIALDRDKLPAEDSDIWELRDALLVRLNAAQHRVQTDVCECVAKSLEPYREPLFCDRCGLRKRR